MCGMRGDATEINALSTLMVKCQTGYAINKKITKEDEEESYAVELIKRYSTQNTRNMVITKESNFLIYRNSRVIILKRLKRQS